MIPIPLCDRRGFAFDEFGGNSLGLVLVKAGVAEAGPALAKAFGGNLVADVLGTARPPRNVWPRYLFRFRGHDWTIFLFAGPVAEGRVEQVSRQMQKCCLYAAHEDTSDWSNFVVFDRGERAEEYTWGFDDSEGIEESREALPEALDLRDGGNQWDWDVRYRGSQYLFWSREHRYSAAQIATGDAFLDTLFRSHDAYMPNWDCLPDLRDEGWFSGEAAAVEDYERVDALYLPRIV